MTRLVLHLPSLAEGPGTGFPLGDESSTYGSMCGVMFEMILTEPAALPDSGRDNILLAREGLGGFAGGGPLERRVRPRLSTLRLG